MKLAYVSICIFLLLSFRSPDPAWEDLLDKDLTKWEKYLSFRHKRSYNGKVPVDEEGRPIVPIGYNTDPDGVFTIIEENKSPVLRVSGEIYGCVFTKTEYENYHLRLKVKWGEAKHEPRTEKLRDSGILYHSIGEAGAEYWRSWMLSQEFQIMEGHMGDYWQQATSGIDIRAFLPEGRMNSVANEKQPFLAFGEGHGEGFCLRSENVEKPHGDWNTLELICFGDKSLHIVNGQVVMVLKNSRYLKDGRQTPLKRGKIQLQSEAAEVYFKEIQIKKLTGLPSRYQSLFVD